MRLHALRMGHLNHTSTGIHVEKNQIDLASALLGRCVNMLGNASELPWYQRSPACLSHGAIAQSLNGISRVLNHTTNNTI